MRMRRRTCSEVANATPAAVHVHPVCTWSAGSHGIGYFDVPPWWKLFGAVLTRPMIGSQLCDTGSGPQVFTRFITTLDLNLATARFESKTRSAKPANASMLGSATIITNV
jgi:hypothetical protein